MIETTLTELVKILGPNLLSYLLKRVPDIQTLYSILLRQDLINEVNRVTCLSEANEENNVRRAVAKSLYPELDYPLTEYLKKLKGAKDIHFITSFIYKDERIGHMITYPIKKTCVNSFLEKKYESGNDFIPEDIAPSMKNAFGYYVAYLISYQDKNRKLVALRSAMLLSKLLASSKKENVFVFTKPSKWTRKIVSKHRFMKIDQHSRALDVIHYIDRASLLKVS